MVGAGHPKGTRPARGAHRAPQKIHLSLRIAIVARFALCRKQIQQWVCFLHGERLEGTPGSPACGAHRAPLKTTQPL